MIRTQVLLTEEQDQALERLSAEQRESKASLVRRAVDLLLRHGAGAATQPSIRSRAIAAAGRFDSGVGDVAERHDAYLEDAFSR